jgi:hypothetical protein
LPLREAEAGDHLESGSVGLDDGRFALVEVLPADQTSASSR